MCVGGDPYGGEYGCGLYFCYEHLYYGKNTPQLCARCLDGESPFEASDDHSEWTEFKMTDPSWAEWRKENGL